MKKTVLAVTAWQTDSVKRKPLCKGSNYLLSVNIYSKDYSEISAPHLILLYIYTVYLQAFL
jgi:hypothetical protein